MKLKKKYKKCKSKSEVKALLLQNIPLRHSMSSGGPPGVDCDNPKDEIERILCEMMRG